MGLCCLWPSGATVEESAWLCSNAQSVNTFKRVRISTGHWRRPVRFRRNSNGESWQQIWNHPPFDIQAPGDQRGVHNLQICCHDFPSEFSRNLPGCLPIAMHIQMLKSKHIEFDTDAKKWRRHVAVGRPKRSTDAQKYSRYYSVSSLPDQWCSGALTKWFINNTFKGLYTPSTGI